MKWIKTRRNKIVPEIVVKQNEKGEESAGINDKPMGVNYTELVPILIKAIQEQQSEMEAMKLRIQELEKGK